MNHKPRILVTGATGQGKQVIPHLAANKNLEHVAALRSPKKAQGIGVHVVCLDLDKPETVAPALEGWIAYSWSRATPFSYETRPSKEFYENALAAPICWSVFWPTLRLAKSVGQRFTHLGQKGTPIIPRSMRRR